MKRISLFGLVLGLALAGLFMIARNGQAETKPAAAAVTFSKDVAPIVFENCAVCHRPGEAAPMSLLSYKDVRPWAKSIRATVVSRQMPPWYADPNHGEFINDRRLSQKQIDTISAWVDGGAKEGDPKDLPAAPKFSDAGWAIGKPDVILPMPVDCTVPADGEVPYKYYAVPTNFTEDKWVQMAEIKRGAASVVHHVIVSVREPGQGPMPPAGEIKLGTQRVNPEAADPQRQAAAAAAATAQTRPLNPAAADPQRQQAPAAAAQNRGTNPDGMLVGWAPGMSPLVLRPGHAKLIKKGSVLIFQMHYTTTGTSATDRTSVGLAFAKAPVEKRYIINGPGSRNLVIPPNAANYESTSSFTFKEDSHIWGFMPHMHLRGKDFKYTLVLPDGTRKVLLNVPKYDFNWQLNYWVKDPVAAPAGSRLECVAHHDNSTANKYNPDPNITVYWGDQTWEEMMIGWFDYTIDKQDLRAETASRK
ncbi:MAG: thiol-disulfide isomerase [Blastocatellia bacterium]